MVVRDLEILETCVMRVLIIYLENVLFPLEPVVQVIDRMHASRELDDNHAIGEDRVVECMVDTMAFFVLAKLNLIKLDSPCL